MDIVTQDALVTDFYNLIAKYDTCLAHTDEQVNFCEKNCTGHGCPIQMELAKECALLAKHIYFNGWLNSQKP